MGVRVRNFVRVLVFGEREVGAQIGSGGGGRGRGEVRDGRKIQFLVDVSPPL